MPENNQEIEIMPTPEFLTGFNEGYTLREQLPELAKSLEQSLANNNSERTQGFRSGINQYDLDNDKNLYPDWMKNHQQGYEDVAPDKGYEDVEPEKD